MPAIDKDPTQEAILYQPEGGVSCSFVVANMPAGTRVTSVYGFRTSFPCKSTYVTSFRSGPLANPTFAKNAIASGSIIPPLGEGSAVRRTDLAVGWAVVLLGACGVVAMAVAFLWRA